MISESTKISEDINVLCSNPAVSVICYLHKDSQITTDSNDESSPNESAPGHVLMPKNTSKGENKQQTPAVHATQAQKHSKSIFNRAKAAPHS